MRALTKLTTTKSEAIVKNPRRPMTTKISTVD